MHFGLKDIPVRTVGEDYIQVDFAGIDLAQPRKLSIHRVSSRLGSRLQEMNSACGLW